MNKVTGVVDRVNGCNVRIKYLTQIIDKKYLKRINRNLYVKAHSNFAVNVGDVVTAMLCAPISKTKKYIIKEFAK